MEAISKPSWEEQLFHKKSKQILKPFKRQPHKMVKHTQMIRRFFSTLVLVFLLLTFNM